jgi:hypothetical protein
MMVECTLETETQQPNDQPIDILRNGPLRVPTFYSYTGSIGDRVVFGVCVSVFFGLIHCVAWYDEFPSSQGEMGMENISHYRISSAPAAHIVVHRGPDGNSELGVQSFVPSCVRALLACISLRG